MRILMTGGGTAGHINPALAIAETVLRNCPDAKIEFVGIRGGKEEDLVPRAGYRLHYVNSKGFVRPLWSPSNVKAAYLALVSPYQRQTTRILDEFRPDLVIGTGGYPCWPLIAAAARRGIPTALHESNASPGIAVKKLQTRVDRIWVNFRESVDRLHTNRPVVKVGNPILGEFGTLSRTEARRILGIPQEQPMLLSFGGSLGADALNRAMLSVMESELGAKEKILFVHAAGKSGYAKAREQYERLDASRRTHCILKDYIYDMPLWMAAADLIISRAGAMTLSELAMMRKASVLVPSPNVTDNHQYYNAKALADANAAVLIEEKQLNDGDFTKTLEELLSSEEKRRTLESNIAVFADPDANRRIWQEILSLTQWNQKKKNSKGKETR